ncbi:hypothetical protein [Bradyrhizobium sp. SZCCHNR1002]|uniref:hypothetical protein n=1 Tax=unclassified Bradyrhizobium TaxID=2631580 RepID=UPI0039657F47
MATALLLGLVTSSAARAAEPSGCDKFKWDITRERAALTATDRQKLDSGADLAGLPAQGISLSLRPFPDAKLPAAPERAPKEGSFAGFIRTRTAPKAGIYTVSLSAAAWIDVVQDGKVLRPIAFSGATDCDGIRKTVKYDLGAQPVALQISGAPEAAISVAILPTE